MFTSAAINTSRYVRKNRTFIYPDNGRNHPTIVHKLKFLITISLTFPLQVVNGWYYLLTEDIGRRKHLRVVDRKSGVSPDDRPAKNVSPSAHTDLNWMDRHIVSSANNYKKNQKNLVNFSTKIQYYILINKNFSR